MLNEDGGQSLANLTVEESARVSCSATCSGVENVPMLNEDEEPTLVNLTTEENAGARCSAMSSSPPIQPNNGVNQGGFKVFRPWADGYYSIIPAMGQPTPSSANN